MAFRLEDEIRGRVTFQVNDTTCTLCIGTVVRLSYSLTIAVFIFTYFVGFPAGF